MRILRWNFRAPVAAGHEPVLAALSIAAVVLMVGCSEAGIVSPEEGLLAVQVMTETDDSTVVDFVDGIEGCDPETAIVPCEEEPGYGGNKGQVVPGVTPNTCSGGTPDLDQDGWADSCEWELAERFAPVLRLSSIETASGRETYWAVRPHPQGMLGKQSVYIVYLLGYYEDAGEPYTGATAHAGDSEFIVLRLESLNGASDTWYLNAMYLSAHWGHGIADRSRWYVPSEIDSNHNGRPFVYVSAGKHANYNSASRCNYQSQDLCTSPFRDTVVLTYSNRNVGQSWSQLLDCVPSQFPNFYTGTECFWTRQRFRGWQDRDPPADYYRDVLDFFEGL